MPDETLPQPKSSDGAPFGSTPATTATPDRGFEAAALQQVGVVVQQLLKIVSGVGAGTQVGKTILEILPKLSKLVPPGAVTPAGSQQQLQRAMMEAIQRNQGMQAYKANAAKDIAGGGGQPGQPPPAAPQAAPQAAPPMGV